MDSIKGALSSKGVWGGLIAAVGGLAPVIGHFTGLGPADVQEAGGHVQNIVVAVGGLIAIYGRIRATSYIGGLFKV